MWNVANHIPGIERKRYLELGIYLGTNRDLVHAAERLSVDIMPAGNPSFLGTTDEYFFQLDERERFDVAYIDACHLYNFVYRDFNNVQRRLNPGGVIMCHDLVPVTESDIDPGLSGDAYKLLLLIYHRCPEYRNWRVFAGDSGLGVFIDPPHLDFFDYENFANATYQDLLAALDSLTADGRATRSYEDIFRFVRTASHP